MKYIKKILSIITATSLVLGCIVLFSLCESQGTPMVLITLNNDLQIRCELYPDDAPITVDNFIKLVKEKKL